MNIRRGDIWMADLTSHQAEANGKIRPVVIVQNNVGNDRSDSFIAAVITSKKKKPMPTHVYMRMCCGLRKDSTILCEHLVTVTQSMLIKQIGTIVNTKYERMLNNALCASLQLNGWRWSK